MSIPTPIAHRFDKEMEQLATQPQPRWLRKQRLESYARFQQTGLPTTHMEAWKYTTLDPLARTMAPGVDIDITAAKSSLFDTLYPLRIEITAGKLQNLDALQKTLPNGIKVMPLTHALSTSQPEAMAAFDTQSGKHEPLTDFNRALWQDGLYIEIAPGTALTRPIYLVQTDGAGTAQLWHLIVLRKGSSATLIQHRLSNASKPVYTNALMECLLRPNAKLLHLDIQQDALETIHTHRTAVQLEANSHYEHFALNSGGRIARNDLWVNLSAPQASCVLNGLTLGWQRSHVDHHTHVDHIQPHTMSRQLYKSVLWDRTRSVFNGTVHVAQRAAGTDAQQSNRNLLLSKWAEADSKPQLEIYADEVKCSHGAATGGLDPNQLFYLRSRGLSDQVAQRMLIEAFAAETLNGLPNELRSVTGEWLRKQLEEQHAE